MYDHNDQQAYQHASHAGDEAIVTGGAGGYNLELRAVYYLHAKLAEQLGQLQDDYVSFPPTAWQITAVELQPFRTLDERYGESAVWGVMQFVDQPGGAFAFLDTQACQVVTGIPEDQLGSDEGIGYVETFLTRLGEQFMVCWQEIAHFDVQMFPAPVAPSLPELQGMFAGLNANTPIITTAFRVTQMGSHASARVVIGVPQAYLLHLGAALQAVGETTYGTTDPSFFHERFANLQDVPVPVTVVLGLTEMTVADLQNLEEGDVIELNTTVGLPLPVQVGSIALQGKPGTSADGRRLAVQIVSPQA